MTDRMRGPVEGYSPGQFTWLAFANLITLLVIGVFCGIVPALLFLLGLALGLIYGVAGSR